MRINLYVNGDRIRFWLNTGWYRGNEFALLNLQLFEFSGSDMITIFGIQITKMSFCFGVYLEGTK